ncbi:MAG TPA: ABC transporter permease [Planctomycetota bacterium]|nr:ABC transporter permease [Planctomycetota bacterium]
MTSYLIRRLLASIPLLFVVSFLVFVLSRAGGRDPVDAILGEKGTPEARERVTREYKLDRPILVQYGSYLEGILTRGDFGKSYIMQEQPVAEQIGRRFPPTVELATAAMLIAILIGIPAGLVSAVWRNTWIDYLVMGVSLLGISIPVFWLGLLLIFALGGWLPIGGNIDPSLIIDPHTGFMLIDAALSEEPGAFGDALRHLVLPAMTLATIPLAMTARITRASLLDVMGSDYIRTARAKGLSGLKVVTRHAFRNALIPVVTLLGLEFGYLLGGAVLTETVFSWPGMGTYVVDAVFQTDPMAICGASIVIATTFIAVNLLVDLLYAFVDPRIRYT